MMKCPTCGASFGASQRLCPTDGAVLEPVESREDKLIGAILDGKYRLDSFLSRGGMGAVFRGTHVMLGRPVAVKMINPDLVTSSEVVRRFQREARAATQLQHPNVVDVYDLGQTPDGTLYIVMELVSGRSLKDAIRASGCLEPRRIVRILGGVCDGLAQAHRRGIIHRDLKPQNVMLTVDANGVETAKIVDFGIAKTFEPDAHTQLTATGSTIGTPYYMSPEQASGAVIDGRSDIYSLGIILYEMLTGEVPFDDPSLPSVLLKHLTETPQPPSLKRPDLHVPPALEAIALRCLAKTPAERFENAEALAVALRRALPPGPDDEATLRVGAAPVGLDDPTVRLSGAHTVRSAPTASAELPAAAAMRAAAAPSPIQQPPLAVAPLPAPAVHAATAPGTQPTVAAPVPPPPPAVPHTPAARRGGSALPLVAVVLLAVVALAGGAYYTLVLRQSGAVSSADQPPLSPPPQASPAAGVEPPAPTPPPVAASGAPVTAKQSPSASSPGQVAAAASSAAEPPARARGGAPSTGTAAASGGDTRRPDASPRPPSPTPRSDAAAAPAATTAAPAPAAQPAALPATPRVSFACVGPTEICSLLRSAMQETAARQGLTMVRTGAHVELGARVELIEERVDRQFGTIMAVRTYSIDFEGEAPEFDDDVPMAPAQTVSADARLGGERFAEAARRAASAAVERVQQYWAKKRQ